MDRDETAAAFAFATAMARLRDLGVIAAGEAYEAVLIVIDALEPVGMLDLEPDELAEIGRCDLAPRR